MSDLSRQFLSDVTVFMKYSKYLSEEKRRETWEETVTRNKDMHIDKFPELRDEIENAYQFVYDKKIVPSMRALQFSGKPIRLAPNRQYNCAYGPVDHLDMFSETMFLLLGGTGVGYSVQKHHVRQLPPILGTSEQRRRFVIGDSIEGWADAVKVLMESYFYRKPAVDFVFEDIRSKGSLLVTSGGRAPGPQPLRECLSNIKQILDAKKIGSKLQPIEAHDIMCHIAEAVLAGGIRRAAMIAGFSLTDRHMLRAKGNYLLLDCKHFHGKMYNVTWEDPYYGIQTKLIRLEKEDEITGMMASIGGTIPSWRVHPHRGRANNSVILLRHKIRKKDFKALWRAIQESGAGEPGIFFTNDKEWFANPCVEISLRPNSFCNLSEINGGTVTCQEDLNNRARAAAFIGTLQASYTDFHYLRPIWKENCEKDALLGVSITGIASNKLKGLNLEEASRCVLEENARVAPMIGINLAARACCLKPSGTSASALMQSSGVHAWHSMFFIRMIRVGKDEAIYKFMMEHHPKLVEDELEHPDKMAVIKIPIAAPSGAIVREDENAFDLLERVKKFNLEWIRPSHRDGHNYHNVSCTVSIRDNEWVGVGEWLWKNRDTFTGIAVLPYFGGTYRQKPFSECSKEEYEDLLQYVTKIDLSIIVEEQDDTNLQGELACAGGACEL